MDTTSSPIVQPYIPSLPGVFLQFPIFEDPKLAELRANIGEELFNQLSDEDKYFILETEGIIDLGYEASIEDLERIMRYIEEDEG